MEPDILERVLDGREKPMNLPFALLKNITGHFSQDQVLGRGGFATVYKGVLPNGYVAVKRIRNEHSIDEKIFYREVDSLLAINHKNVVRFLGFCASTDQTAIEVEGSRQHIYAEIRERLLCFEYISNGSLQEHINDELRGLEWNTRYQIITGICEGLHHLHVEKHIYHMDLKPANILLDDHMVPKIADFGLSRLDEKSKTMNEGRFGSLGYCAPEYLCHGKMSFKSDMYSLGIIIIEVVTGDKCIPDNNKNNVLRKWRHRWKKSEKATPFSFQQVTKCIEIGLLCQDIDPCRRPFIWDVIHDIKLEGANGHISNTDESIVGQISPYLEDDMLGIEPLELHFPYDHNKQISCSLRLTNETDSHIAFNVQKMSPIPYIIQPHTGILVPQSRCSVDITLKLLDKARQDMRRADEFIVWSTIVNDGLAIEDITTCMFDKETGRSVDKVNLDVAFDAQLQRELPDVHPLELDLSLEFNKLDTTQVLNSLLQAPVPTSSTKNKRWKFITEAFKHKMGLDPDHLANKLKAMKDAIRECYAGRSSNMHMAELHGFACNLVLHKHSEELYNAMEVTMASEVQGLGRALDAAPDGTLFLQELLAMWHRHRSAANDISTMLMYMNWTFVRMEHKMPVYELGIDLWRDSVIRSDKVRPRLIEAVRREREGKKATTTNGSLADVKKMLEELEDGVYSEIMYGPPGADLGIELSRGEIFEV